MNHTWLGRLFPILLLAVLLPGCESGSGGHSQTVVHGHAGYYDPWYYGSGYYDDWDDDWYYAPPVYHRPGQKPDKPATPDRPGLKPEHPIARPPIARPPGDGRPSARPLPSQRPSIPSRARPAHTGSRSSLRGSGMRGGGMRGVGRRR